MGMFKVIHCRNTPARVPTGAAATGYAASTPAGTELQPAEVRRSGSAR